MHGYTGTLAEQLGRFDCDPAVGLTTRQVEDCRESFGPNAPPPKAQKSHITRFLLAARQPMVAILLLAAAAELLISPARRDVGIIGPVMVILLVFAGLTLILWREDKTTLAVERLRLARAAKAKVIREGVLSIIPAGEIVPGDIAVLSEGDIIPADGRLTRSENLTCDERALTGTIQEKNSEAILPDDTPIGERVNMVFSSCAVTGGCGQFLVTATGGGTEMQTRAAGADDQAVSLIQTEFEEGGKLMAVAGLLAGGVLFLAGLLHGFPPAQLLLAAAAFAVTTLPGGVRAALKLTLARKAEEVSEDGVALRDPSTLETLASVDVILADKAGMLTLERAKLRKIWLAGSGGEDYADQISEPAAHLLLLAALACDGRVELREEEVARTGDSEETAILTAALAHGMTTRELETRYPRVFALPPNRGLTVTVHQVGDHLLAITKGGFEDVLPRCQNAESRSASLANQKMGGGELSVTAVAVRELSILPQDSADLTGELTLIGLLGVYDPPFAQAQEAVVRCRQAGVRTVMLTADSEITARAIAEELGILEEGEQVLTGDALAGMNDQALTQKIGSYSVCARITPKDKHRIVQAWRARGETVAVTGRTGADSPALKAAHLGIALGNEPAGLAAAASSVLFTGEGLPDLAKSICGARGAAARLRRVVAFLIGTSLAVGFALLTAASLGFGLPLLPTHLLLVNLAGVALIAPALGMSSAGDEVMRKAPPPIGHKMFDYQARLIAGAQGICLGLLTLTGYYLGARASLSRYIPPGEEVGVTMAFLVLMIGLLGCALGCKSTHSIFSPVGQWNSPLTRTLAGILATCVLSGMIPLMREVLGLSELSMLHHLWVAALSLIPLVLSEIAKSVRALLENGEWQPERRDSGQLTIDN